MKKYIVASLVLLLISSFTFQTSPSFAYSTEADAVNHKIKLTEEQREELASIYREMLETKKKLVTKYMEFGVISKDKGEEILERMEERHKKLEEDGFVPQWHKYEKGKKKHHKHKKHED